MKTKRLLLVGLALVFCSFTSAGVVDETLAKSIARNYFYEAYGFKKSIPPDSLKPSIISVLKGDDEEPLLYFINVSPSGYLIVAGDDRAYPVLSYSTSEHWTEENWLTLPPAAIELINSYANQIQIIINSELIVSEEISDLWEKYSKIEKLTPEKTKQTFELTAISALHWNQNEFYNQQCPQTGGVHPPGFADYDNRCPAGCVAVAMAQIMRYWQWPESGLGQNTYNDPANQTGLPCNQADPSYGPQTADFGNADYNWSIMPHTLSEHNIEVATIIRHAGVAVNMDYSYCGSGSNINNARNAFINNFNYSANATIRFKDNNIEWDDWEGLIKSEINAGRPVYYRGVSGAGGHAFICYAYENNETYSRFKFNWGWGGVDHDTWYTLRSVNGQNLIQFSVSQGMITELIPNSPFQYCPGIPTISYQGQTYNTLKIGNHCWMKENLNVGIMLQSNQPSSNNGVIEKYCYNNDPANCQTYGGLYTWDEMMQYSSQEGAQGICPNGWHIPTDEEWKILAGQIDSQYPVGHPVWDNTGWRGFDAGGKMKSTGTSLWQAPNTGANNESGFTGLPGGTCNTGGFFSGINNYAYFWSSTQPNNFSGMYHRLDYNDSRLYRTTRLKGFRLSVRCVKALTSNISGTIADFDNGNGVSDATIVLTGFNNSFTTNSLANGTYSIAGVPTGNYNLSVMKAGYQSNNQNVFITGEPEQVINVSLIPGGSNFVEINTMLTAYANNVVESPANFFTLSGNVNINNVLYFEGELKVDRRSNLENKEVFGAGSIYVPNVGGQVKVISPGGIPFKFYESADTLIAKGEGYFFELPVMLQGFPLTLAGIKLTPGSAEARLLAIPKIPYPIDFIIKEYIDEGIPTALKNVSGVIIYSMLSGENFEIDLKNLKANLGLVAIRDLNLYYKSAEQVFGGDLLLRIPGTPQKPSRYQPEGDSLSVVIRDEEGHVVNEVSFNEFVETLRILGSDFIEVKMVIEFVSGALNNLSVTISNTHIPLFTTGLIITEIHGGVYGLASKDWHLEVRVDIETGLSKIPGTDKAPLKLNDFGVMIQPMNVFRGSGTLQVFESDVAGGFVEYNRLKSSVTMEGNFNLAGILDGGLYANVQHRKFTGSGHFSVMTPCDLPWYLNWVQCKTVGSAYAEVNNQSFQSEVDLRWISFAQKMEFGKQGFPWFHYYLGRNLNRLHQIWKGTRDGKQAISFQVPENSGQILVIAADTINPTLFDFTLQGPTGQLFDMDNAFHYEQDVINQQTIMSLHQPIEGEWHLLTAYEGDLAIYVMGVDQRPIALVDQPSAKRTRSNEISLTFNDYADTVNVQVFYNTHNKRFDGSFIAEFTLINNATLNFTWENQDVPNGEYYIYSRIDDGKNTPVLQYATGSIWVENDPNIEIPQNFGAVQQGDSVNVNWDAPMQPNTFAAAVHYKDLSTGRTEQQPVVGDNNTTLKNLIPGRGYEIWCKFINDEGTYSPKSNVVTLEFASSNRSNNPPYFTMDRDSIFVFISGENSHYTLQASDADGDLLTFSIPGDTLGINITGNQFSWLPNIEQRGVYLVRFVVSDGSETDTTNLQLVVYTPEQVETRLAFNSVRLYKADNTFIILRNFFSEQPTQNVTLTNMRTMEQTVVECRRVNNFEYMGQFFLSFQNRSEITVAEGDTIRASYTWNDETHYAYAYYDTNPQPTDVTPPGIISDLSAERLENNRVKLKWTATGNDGDIGKAYRYDIRYAYEPIENEGVYFTAHRILNFPYPSMSGEQDSLIINLANLVDITLHENIYFSIKAEDEMQNRGGLSNSPGVSCFVDPVNVIANVDNVYNIIVTWDGSLPDGRSNGIQHYNLFRKFNQGSMSLLQTGLTETSYTDNLKILPDGSYQYAVQAVYSAGNSDTVYSAPVLLERFVNVNLLLSLQGRTNYQGIALEMTGQDTVYSQQFIRTTNPTGLVMLNNVFFGKYAVEASKDDFITLFDTITISKNNNSFNLELMRFIHQDLLIENLNVTGGADTCVEALQTIVVSGLNVETGSKLNLTAGQSINIQAQSHIESGAQFRAFIDETGQFCYLMKSIIASSDGENERIIQDQYYSKEQAFFSLFPNPTPGSFILHLKEATESVITVEIYSMMGEMVLKQELAGQSQYQISLSALQSGIYLIRVLNDAEIGAKKIILKR